MNRQLIFLELNEVNLEYVQRYCRKGLLANFHHLLTQHGWAETTSEQRYEDLEPWIQWVTAHTGQTLAQHGVFRLGDIVNHDIPQIWEVLEAKGLRVGAISPMNAKNRSSSPAFFVPDPWTRTDVSAGPRLRRLYSAIAQAVNENAQGRIDLKSLWNLLAGYVAYARRRSYPEQIRLALTSRSAPWRKAMLLDSILADVFIQESRRTRPNFATLFLNAAAHIQHHYLFSSTVYPGENRNPAWYVDPDEDPVLEVYQCYDRILGEIRVNFPNARIMVATGLHQDPHDRVTYYWRLRDHAHFLKKIDVECVRVEPRMSRDFLVVCSDRSHACATERMLLSARAHDGTPLFEVDNRGVDLFVMLVYPHEITPAMQIAVGERHFTNFYDDVAFVALKNGQHNGVGYFIDTGLRQGHGEHSLPLCELFSRMLAAFEADIGQQSAYGGVRAG